MSTGTSKVTPWQASGALGSMVTVRSTIALSFFGMTGKVVGAATDSADAGHDASRLTGSGLTAVTAYGRGASLRTITVATPEAPGRRPETDVADALTSGPPKVAVADPLPGLE
jgi:hypothetical protein